MKIDLSTIDREQFMVHPHVIAGETCYLVQPQHIGTKFTQTNKIFRSSVWTAEGELVSASFPKFVNWGENPENFPLPSSLDDAKLIEKIDGSTLIVSNFRGEIIIRTRGTVDATKLDNGHEIAVLKARYPDAFSPPPGLSYLFEWVSPSNRIVLDYGSEPDIYLTGIIDHEDYSLFEQTSLDCVAATRRWKRPKTYSFNSIAEMLKAVEAFNGVEGICVYHSKGQEIHKVKGASYLALHRMKSELGSQKRIVEAYILSGATDYDSFRSYIQKNFDFEIANQIDRDVQIIAGNMMAVNAVIQEVGKAVEPLKTLSRKDAALHILKEMKDYSPIAFNFLTGKPIESKHIELVYYRLFPS